MNTYLCKWPNGGLVLISARDEADFHDKLDHEDDPSAAEYVKVGSRTHIAIEMHDGKIVASDLRTEEAIEWSKVKFGAKEFAAVFNLPEPTEPSDIAAVLKVANSVGCCSAQ